MELLTILVLNVLISSLTFAIMYGVWKYLLGKENVRYGIGLGYYILRVVVIMLLFPFFLVLLWIRGGYDHYGFLYVWTPFAGSFIRALVLVWLTGAFIRCLNCLGQIMRYHHMNRGMMVCGRRVYELAGRIAVQMHIRRRIRLYESYSLLSPELGGWSRPEIRLPAQHYGDEILNNIITHELVHYKSGDKLVREIMLVLACVHWFNPVCRDAMAQLKIWDEYHCDYITCQCQHIDPCSYYETLYGMHKLGEHRKSLLKSSFYEEKSDLRKRLEQVKYHETKTRRNRLRTWLATFIFMAGGVAIALAASEGVAYAYDMVAETLVTMAWVEEDSGNDALAKYIRIPDEKIALGYAAFGEAASFAGESFDCTLKDQIYSTSGIWLKEGDELVVSVKVWPEDINIKVGIVQPDGTWCYVYLNEIIDHTFEIMQDGRHKIFVWNETDTEINAVGYYMTVHPNGS